MLLHQYLGALLAILLKKHLTKSLWVFNNLVNISQWTFLWCTKLQELSSFLCLPTHFLDTSWQSISSIECSAVLGSFCVPFTLAQCPPSKSLTESSVILSSPSNSQQRSSSAPPRICSMPTWKSSTEITTKFCLQLCFSYTALPLEVFNNLTSLLLELLIPVLCLCTFLSDSSEFRSASSVHGYQDLNVLSHPPGVKPQRPTWNHTNSLQMH